MANRYTQNSLKTSIITSLLCIGAFAPASKGAPYPGPARLGPSTKAAMLSSGALPLSFEVNRRQAAGDVRFLSRGRGYSLELRDSTATLGLTSPLGWKSKVAMTLAGAHPKRIEGDRPLPGVV